MNGLCAVKAILLATGVVAFSTSVALSAGAKGCVRTAGGYIVCDQGNGQICTTPPGGGRITCVTSGKGPPPQKCYSLPDGTRICVSGQ